VAEALNGKAPRLEPVGGFRLYAWLTSEAEGGITEDDFIVAATIDELSELPSLVQEKKRRQRLWA